MKIKLYLLTGLLVILILLLVIFPRSVPTSKINNPSISEIVKSENLSKEVCMTFYNNYHDPVFAKAASNNQRDIEFIANLAIVNDTNVDTSIYNKFINFGNTSVISALDTCAWISELNIVKYKSKLSETNNSAVEKIYSYSLQVEEENLKLFATELTKYNQTYTPKYLSEEEYNKIVSH